ncbi:MAG: hypothetical protein JNM36_01545 [Chitinophagales bacterium]|jgi:hypothetical protein|nr:hypothetical protein [Chitinophagales bacterium]
MKKNIFAIILAMLSSTVIAVAQCPMCKAAAESNLKDGGTAALGLNTGILYLFFTPYLIVAIIGYIWWRNNKKANTLETNVQVEGE